MTPLYMFDGAQTCIPIESRARFIRLVKPVSLWRSTIFKDSVCLSCGSRAIRLEHSVSDCSEVLSCLTYSGVPVLLPRRNPSKKKPNAY